MAELLLRSFSARLTEGQIPANLFAPFAALLVLRWADQQEADQEAIAAFDGTSFAPTLVPGSRFRDFCDLRGPALAAALTEQVASGLARSRDAGAGALVRRIEPVIGSVARLDAETLGALLDDVQALPIVTGADRDRALDAFDSALARFNDASRGGWFLSPRPVVDLVVELAAPRPGQRIYDPCFGVATLLTACARRVREQIRAGRSEDLLEAQRGAFLGVEINPEAFVIGLARMILAGVNHPALELGNTLERPLPRDRAAEGFDCIVAEPPFGARLLPDAASQFPVKATSSEALFLQHIAASLRPGGRAVVVLPQGAFFRAGADAAVRRILLEEYHVEVVVSLPPTIYLPFANVRTGVLVFRREASSENVYFVNAEEPIGEPVRVDPEAPPFDSAALARSALGRGGGYRVRDASVEELKQNGASLMPPRRDGPLPAFLQAVRAADPSLPVRPLEDVADLFAGLRTKIGDIGTGDGDPSLLGLLGPAEVEDGLTRPPAKFLAKKAIVPPNLRLRSGDVLFTSAGMVGRAAVVANGAMGRVAGNGLVVLRPREGLSPHYLAAMLQSAPVRAWVTESVRGSSSVSLPLSELRRLVIPVPDVSLQDRVLRAMRRDAGDAAAVLLSLLNATVEDPIVKWLGTSGAVQALLAMRDAQLDEVAALEALNRVAEESLAVNLPLTDETPDLARWFTQVQRALSPFLGFENVPPGPERLAILMNAFIGVTGAVFVTTRVDGSWGTHASAFSSAILSVIEPLFHRQARAFRLIPSFEPAGVDAGTISTVTLRVRNEGPMPVRGLSVRAQLTSDVQLRSGAEYLDAGAEITASATFTAPSTTGVIDVEATWSALQLDGRTVDGKLPLALEVRPAAEVAPAPVDLGPSPYIVGSPISSPEMLYGRDALIRDIKRQLATDHRANIILLEGNRRTGKTSILKKLEAPGDLPGWIPVNIDLQRGEGNAGCAGLSSKEIFRLLAEELALASHKAGTPVWLPNQPPPDPGRRFALQLGPALRAYFEDDHPFEAFEIYLVTVIEAVAPRRILLMLDEFDKIQEGIDAGITSPQVPGNLRYLFHTHPEVGGILSGSRRLTRLRNEYWSALFGIGYPIRVEPLAVEDARALVAGPAAGRLVYVPEARDRIVDLCARQPFLIQTLCNHIFTQMQERGERMVTLDTVERAAAKMAETCEHFETLWGYAGTARRRLILALLCDLVRGSEGRALDAGTLEDALVARGVDIPPEGLGDDIAHLRELELIELETYDGYQRYRLTIPLLVEWIRRNKDFSDLARRAAREQDGIDA